MRRAYLLVEMIVVMATLPIFMIMVGGVFMVLSREVPRSSELVSEQALVQQVLDQIEEDVDSAQSLPRSYRGLSQDERTLLVERAGDVLVYRAEGGKVTKAVVDPCGVPGEWVSEWAVPDAEITWKLLGTASQAQAVEVHSHMVQRRSTGNRRCLANARVFFPMARSEEVLP